MILTLKGHSEVMQPWVSWGCGGVPLSQSAHSGQSTRSRSVLGGGGYHVLRQQAGVFSRCSAAQVGRSSRLVVSVAWWKATTTAKRTQRLCGVGY